MIDFFKTPRLQLAIEQAGASESDIQILETVHKRFLTQFEEELSRNMKKAYEPEVLLRQWQIYHDEVVKPVLEKLADYIDNKLAEGYPRHPLIQEIRTHAYQSYTDTTMSDPREYLRNTELSKIDRDNTNIYSAVTRMLTKYATVMCNRCTRGRELERLGRIDEAIDLYKQNVYDQHNGSMSYDRLRIIHTRQKEYQLAIQACEAYVALSDPHAKADDRFEHHLAKLRKKMQKQLATA